MTIRLMRIACWITKATNTHSEYVILIAFQLQYWLQEHSWTLRYRYIACLVIRWMCWVAICSIYIYICVCVCVCLFVCLFVCLAYSEFPSSSCCDMLTISVVPHCHTFISSLSLFFPYFLCSVIVLLSFHHFYLPYSLSLTACHAVFVYFKLRWYCFPKRFFSSPERPDRLWGPSSFLFNGYGVLSPGVKQPGRDIYHSPPSIADVEI
jgi:hypothetical protein